MVRSKHMASTVVMVHGRRIAVDASGVLQGTTAEEEAYLLSIRGYETVKPAEPGKAAAGAAVVQTVELASTVPGVRVFADTYSDGEVKLRRETVQVTNANAVDDPVDEAPEADEPVDEPETTSDEPAEGSKAPAGDEKPVDEAPEAPAPRDAKSPVLPGNLQRLDHASLVALAQKMKAAGRDIDFSEDDSKKVLIAAIRAAV